MLTAKSITVAGVRLQYLEAEPPTPSAQPPLVVLHQLLATAETLTELISYLPTGRRIVAVDILSAYTLDHAPLDMRAASLAALLRDFLAAVSADRPVLIGHSHGGCLALHLALMPQVAPRGLALLCPAHPFAGYRSHVVAFYLTRWGRFLALCIPLAPSRAILWAYNQAAGPTGPITLRHLRPHLRVLRHRDSLRRVLEILATWESDMDNLRTALRAQPITVPTLLLWGDHDTIVPIASAPALQACLSHSQLHTLPGCGHLLPEESPQTCARLLTDWLATPGL